MLLSLINFSTTKIEKFLIQISLLSLPLNLYIVLDLPSFFLGKISLNQTTYLPIASIIFILHFLYLIITKSDFKFISSNINLNWLTIFLASTSLFSIIQFPEFTLWYFTGLLLYLNLLNTNLDQKIISQTLWITTALLSLIGISQFLLQQDLSLQFLGENQLNIDLKGLAKFTNTFTDQSVLRSYSLFSHPNVFAAYLSLSFMITAYAMRHNTIQYLGQLSSFSISGILSTLFQSKKTKHILLICLLLTLVLLLRNPILYHNNITERLSQILNIFYNPNSLKPWEIQPLHNIILLSFFSFTPIHTIITVKLGQLLHALNKQFFFSIFVLAMFDHHLLTNHSIYFMLILCLYTIFEKSHSDHSKNPEHS